MSITFASDPNLSLLVRLLRQDGAPIASFPMAEATDVRGYYRASVPVGLPEGRYDVQILRGQELIGLGELNWYDGQEVDLARMVRRIHAIEGLDPANPLVNTPNSRSAGDVRQRIEGDDQLTTVTATS